MTGWEQATAVSDPSAGFAVTHRRVGQTLKGCATDSVEVGANPKLEGLNARAECWQELGQAVSLVIFCNVSETRDVAVMSPVRRAGSEPGIAGALGLD